MRRFACWESRGAKQTLVDDANRDAQAVFTAVHRPAHILRKDIRREATDPGTQVSEHEVLEALLGGDPDEDRIVPVVGRSGTGKSHLIRWLDANVDRTAERHVVYIEKRGTSLRQVVHKILEGLDREGVRHRERFVELRNEVDKAQTTLDPESARLHLLNELALSVHDHGLDESAGDEERAEREDLAARLPDLLLDAEYRVPLLADGGVIARTVDKAFGKGPDDGEAPAFEDLVIEVRDASRAGVNAREAYDDIRGESATRELALGMLNEQLNHAVASLIGVDRKQIYDVMLEVREALADEGKTLVLLVEDFALLRGLETQLLDAMIADPESRGERMLCPMRSALAVTSGYFDGKETAKTRIHSRGRYVYSLDTDLGGTTGVSTDEVEAFVATYLNAARVGREELQSAFDARDRSTRDRNWVPNACRRCEFQAECHGAFGVAEDYGLYPLNREALDRMVASKLEHFDPRNLLQILEATLREERDKLVDGLFPAPQWADEFPSFRAADGEVLPIVPAEARVAYETRDAATADRRIALMTFWGDAPQAAVNLDPTIHEAFDLAPLEGLPTFVPGGAEPPKSDEHREPEPPDSDGAPEKMAVEPERPRDPMALALDRWGQGLVLEQREALVVRTALADAVLGAREWAALGISSQRLNDVVNNQAFSLGSTAKGGATATSRLIGELEPSARNAFMLQGVMFAASGRGADTDERGLVRWADYAEWVDGCADTALARLREDGSAAATAQLLLLGGAALGIASPADDEEALVEGLFRSPDLNGADDWLRFQARLVEGRTSASRADLREELLAQCGLRQASDDGMLIGIDVAPLVTAIDKLEGSGWEVPDESAFDKFPRAVRQHATMLRNDLQPAVEARLEELAEGRSNALRLLGNEREPRRVIDAVSNAYQVARESFVGKNVDLAARDELERNFLEADPRVLDRLSALDQLNELSWRQSLEVLVVAERENFAPILAYVDWADSALGSMLETATALLQGAESGDSVSKTTADLVGELQALADDLQGVRT